MIKVSQLEKYFNKGKPNEIHVINNTSIEFGNAGLVCILGESGSGKTTLLNTIGGLDTFHGGRIKIDDTSLTRYSRKDTERLRNSKFAYIFQEHYLLQEDTVAYNIRLALNMYGLSEEEKDARVDYVLQAVGMKRYKKRPVSQLSGGQQQRVALARALVKSPDVIFADEPTGNLDEANTMRIMSIIKKISKDCLVILVTHEKQIAELFADRLIQIKDGAIISDIGQEGIQTYHYHDDSNLYLKEYDRQTTSIGQIEISYYSKRENSDIKLNLLYQDGKLYIQSPEEANIVYLHSNSKIQMVDDVKPVFDSQQVEEFDYSLSKIEVKKEATLTWKEIFRLAKKNVAIIGKKQLFLIATFIITAILFVFAMADYMTAAAIDKKTFITEDSHYVLVNAKRNSSASNVQYYDSFNELYRGFIGSNINGDIYIDLKAKFNFTYDSFGQISKKHNILPEASCVTLEHLNPEKLFLGRMPSGRNEVVVDRWILEKFLETDALKSIMTLKDFINLEIVSEIYGTVLTIVGISDTEEPSIYLDKYLGISLVAWADKVASLEQLKAAYPGQYKDIFLASNEVLITEEEYSQMLYKGESLYSAKNGKQYTVIGTYSNDYDVSYVIEDAYYEELLNSYISVNRKFKVYSNQKEEIINYFSPGNYDDTYAQMLISDTYREQLKEFESGRSVNLDARFVSTLTIFLLSLFILYFAMKTNVIKRSQELTVYRLLGITRRSIVAAFLLEIVLITSYTVLPVVLILSSAMKLLAAIPSLQVDIVYPWYSVAGLLLFLYAVNIIIGLIPVYHTIKLPPAQLAQKA
jgi:putative ABC transport system permease protein